MLHSPNAMKILVRAWRWVGFAYSGFKTMYAAATDRDYEVRRGIDLTTHRDRPM